MAAISGNLVVANQVADGGLRNFFEATSLDYSLMSGCISGIVASTIVTVAVSLQTTQVRTADDVTREWEKLISIDNPLNPWEQLYSDELSMFPSTSLMKVDIMSNVFRQARSLSLGIGGICITLFLVVLPVIVVSFGVLSQDQFSGWLRFVFIICIFGMVFVVFVPPIEEVVQIYHAYRGRQTKKCLEDEIKSDNENDCLNTRKC